MNIQHFKKVSVRLVQILFLFISSNSFAQKSANFTYVNKHYDNISIVQYDNYYLKSGMLYEKIKSNNKSDVDSVQIDSKISIKSKEGDYEIIKYLKIYKGQKNSLLSNIVYNEAQIFNDNVPEIVSVMQKIKLNVFFEIYGIKSDFLEKVSLDQIRRIKGRVTNDSGGLNIDKLGKELKDHSKYNLLIESNR